MIAPRLFVLSFLSLAVVAATNFRQEAITGYVQIITPDSNACGISVGQEITAIGACIPVVSQSGLPAGAIAAQITATTPTSTTSQLYSDLNCATAVGSPTVKNWAAACVSGTQTAYLIVTSGSTPPPPIPNSLQSFTLSPTADPAVCTAPFAASVLTSTCADYSLSKAGICQSTTSLAFLDLAIGVFIGGSGLQTCNTPGNPVSSPVLAPASSPSKFGLPTVPTISNVPSAPTSSSSGSSSCFSGSETVMLESGVYKTLRDVEVGDMVQIASVTGELDGFSPVVSKPHGDNHISAEFVQLITESKRAVKVTADHLVLGGSCDSPLSLVSAGSVKAGQCLQTIAGPEVVATASLAKESGVYTVVTLKGGLLVVNSVVASPFAVNHLVANAFYNIHRAVYNFLPAAAKQSVVTQAIQAFGELVTGLF